MAYRERETVTEPFKVLQWYTSEYFEASDTEEGAALYEKNDSTEYDAYVEANTSKYELVDEKHESNDREKNIEYTRYVLKRVADGKFFEVSGGKSQSGNWLGDGGPWDDNYDVNLREVFARTITKVKYE